jgi:hypothetical protein
MVICHHCGSIHSSDGIPGRSERCGVCGKDLRVCLNCSFHKPGAHYDCAETVQDPVREKDRGNFCDFFRPAAGNPKSSRKQEDARRGFESLFRD